MVLKTTGLPVGSIGLMLGKASNIGLPDSEGEIGYWIGVPYWGQGLIPEAVRELMRYGFEELKLEKCGAVILMEMKNQNVFRKNAASGIITRRKTFLVP